MAHQTDRSTPTRVVAAGAGPQTVMVKVTGGVEAALTGDTRDSGPEALDNHRRIDAGRPRQSEPGS